MHRIKPGLVCIIVVAFCLWQGMLFGWRRAALVIIATALGFSLYHASFGFTSAWRKFTSDFDGRGLRAQLILIALVASVAFPILSAGELFGRNIGGYILPVGTSVVVGAFIFGIGMQLGGGCGSGTLFTVGGGNTRMLLTLCGFVIGSVVATSHVHLWYEMPGIGPVSLIKQWGLWTALCVNLLALFSIAALSIYLEKKRHNRILPFTQYSTPFLKRIIYGPWSPITGVCMLAILSILVLIISGRPWGITSAFALWGAKAAQMFGIDVTQWPYWSGWRLSVLHRPVWYDLTSVMNAALVLGAGLAAMLANKFTPKFTFAPLSWLSAILGGLLLGYGARLAFGCNIGAYFGGIISGSLHGWVWLVAGFIGSYVGTRLRPIFGLSVEKVNA